MSNYIMSMATSGFWGSATDRVLAIATFGFWGNRTFPEINDVAKLKLSVKKPELKLSVKKPELTLSVKG